MVLKLLPFPKEGAVLAPGGHQGETNRAYLTRKFAQVLEFLDWHYFPLHCFHQRYVPAKNGATSTHQPVVSLPDDFFLIKLTQAPSCGGTMHWPGPGKQGQLRNTSCVLTLPWTPNTK